MKNILWVILLVGFVNVSVSAQDDGIKLAKKAKKAITNYFLDPGTKSNLTEAKDLIDKAFATGAVEGDGTAWATKGEIYAQFTKNDATMKSINNDYVSQNLDAGLTSFDSFKKSIEKLEKEGAKKDSYKSIAELLPFLDYTWQEYYNLKKYNDAFLVINSMLVGHSMLKEVKLKSPLDNIEDLNLHYFYAGTALLQDGKKDLAIEMLEKSLNGGNKSSDLYENLINANLEINKESALKYIKEGRLLFPENNGILFSEINYYLALNQSDTVINRLLLAIEREPENISVITTLGNTYDKLYQKYETDLDTISSKLYFEKAVQTYNLSLKKDPNNTFANYSLGALYYNKAAIYDRYANSLGLSLADQKKYDYYKALISDLFNIALPYFLAAENSDPKDRNTIIAIREIYAKTNQLEKALEYKKKLEEL